MSVPNQQARALAFLRIAVGLLFLIFAQYKLTSTQFIRHSMTNYIGHFIENGCYPFMQPFLKNLILPNAIFFGAFVSISELLDVICADTQISWRSCRAHGSGGRRILPGLKASHTGRNMQLG